MYLFDEKVGRRRFIKGAATTAAAGGAAAALAGCGSYGAEEHSLGTDAAGAAQWGREAGEWIPSCCNMCGGQSGILVHVVDGVVDKIEPNQWNPVNYTNISKEFFAEYTEEFGVAGEARICPKGNAGIASLYDPDRIKTPLKRSNPDKSPGADPQWEEISWDQAFDEITPKLQALRDAGEAHKLLWISEDHSFTHVQADFCKLYGTPNYSNHSNVCDVARKASFTTVMGEGRPLANFAESKYILLFGWNPTSAIKWVLLPRIITEGIKNGARMVVVDPYMSDTAAKAHEWVPIRPGTDGAFALAMANVIVREELYNKSFIDEWSVGFDEYNELVADKTPEWAEEITSVPAATIERLAREFATTGPALADSWSGPGQHSNGVQSGRAIALLNALVGTWDQPGGMMIPDKHGNSHVSIDASAEVADTLAQPRFDELDKYPLGHKSGVYVQTINNLAEGKGPYQPKMMMCVFQNLVMSIPGRPTVEKALAGLETLVVVDTMLSETAMLADYVLPGTVFLERYDLNTQWVTWSAVGLRQPVVKPLFGQPAEYEVVAELGRRLGLKDADGREFFKIGPSSGEPIEDLTAWYEDNLSNELQQGAPGITLDEMKALPGAVWVDPGGTRYEKYKEPLPADKLATAWFDGDPKEDGTQVYDKPKDDGGKRIGTVLHGKPRRGFYTGSGMVEFMSAGLAEKTGYDGTPVNTLPDYEPRDWQPDSDYPLYLVNWKEASHTHTRTQNNAWLHEIKPYNPLIMNPVTAERLGIGDDDEVIIESSYGKVEARVKTTERMHPEVVGLQHGFGHTALGKLAKGQGTGDSVLRPTKADGLAGGGMHKENCVRVRRK